jgi:hypothetical protein
MRLIENMRTILKIGMLGLFLILVRPASGQSLLAVGRFSGSAGHSQISHSIDFNFGSEPGIAVLSNQVFQGARAHNQ